MTYRGHTVGGALAAVVAVRLMPVTGLTLALTILAAVFGGLAPDLDAPGAYLSRRLGPLHWLMGLLLSNPLTWVAIGYPMRADIPVTRVPRPWSVRWIGPLLRPFLGGGRAAGAVEQLAVGRAVVKRLMGHRSLSHALLGLLLAGTAWFALWSGVAYLLMHHAPDALAPVAPRLHDLLGPLPGVLQSHWPEAAWPVLPISVAFVLGYISHILLDMTTVAGVPLLLPWTLRRCFLLPQPLRIHSS